MTSRSRKHFVAGLTEILDMWEEEAQNAMQIVLDAAMVGHNFPQ